jgi:hypothetical protein
VTTVLTAMVLDRSRMTSRSQRRYGNRTLMKRTHPPGPVPAQAGMTLGNMRELGVHRTADVPNC